MTKTKAKRYPPSLLELMAAKTALEFDGAGQASLKYMDGTALDFTVSAGPSARSCSRSAPHFIAHSCSRRKIVSRLTCTG